MFKEFDLKDFKKLNFKRENFAFFLDNFNSVSKYIDNAKAFYYEEDYVKGVFIITYLSHTDIQIAFYTLDPSLDENESLKLLDKFFEFIDKFAKENGIKNIFTGVNYYNDDLFELMLEKGYSAISYKMHKKIE